MLFSPILPIINLRFIIWIGIQHIFPTAVKHVAGNSGTSENHEARSPATLQQGQF